MRPDQIAEMAAFLNARFDETEAAVYELLNAGVDDSLEISHRPMHVWVNQHPRLEAHEVAKWILADIKSKRQIVEIMTRVSQPGYLTVPTGWAESTLRLLAEPYTGHPSY